MYRSLLALGMGLLLATAGRADLGPPRPVRQIPVDNRITTDKEFPDYVFFVVIGDGGKNGPFVRAVKLDPKTPLEIPGAPRGAGVGRQGALVAVPKNALKGYATEKAFVGALVKGAVEGQVQANTNLDSVEAVAPTDRREKTVWEFKVEKVDKDGIVLTRKDAPAPKKNGGQYAPDDEPEAPLAAAPAPRGGVWVAGLSSALAVTFGGLWAVGRTRRKP